MPPASLYHRENISKVWLEVIDKTESFLRSVITTDGNPTPTTQSGTSSSDFSGFSIHAIFIDFFSSSHLSLVTTINSNSYLKREWWWNISYRHTNKY